MRPRPRGSASTPHLDQVLLMRLLSGEEVADQRTAVMHLSGCASCRSRFEAADPLRRLVGEDLRVSAAGRPVPLPAASGWSLSPLPRRRWVAGLAAAASLALVALTAGHRPSTPASPPSRIAQLTGVIQTAARQHDQHTLQRALREVKAELITLRGAPTAEPQLRADLSALQAQIRALPPEPESAEIENDVQTALTAGDAGGQPEEAGAPARPAHADGGSSPASPPRLVPGGPEATPTPAVPTDQPAPPTPAVPTDQPAPANPPEEPAVSSSEPALSGDAQPGQDQSAQSPPDGASASP
jgi:hypothetical protein